MPHSERSQEFLAQERHSQESNASRMEHDAPDENIERNGAGQDVEMTMASSPIPAVKNLTVDDDLDGDGLDDDWLEAANSADGVSSQPTRYVGSSVLFCAAY